MNLDSCKMKNEMKLMFFNALKEKKSQKDKKLSE